MYTFHDSKGLKKSLEHDCQLPNRHKNLLVQFIDSGYFVDFRRKFRSYVICSENNPRSKIFLKSSATIYLEIQNHLQLHYYMIHPFSMMRVMWEMFMMVVFFILLVYIPIDVCFTAKTSLYERLPRITLDFVCIIDIMMSFITGYQDDTTKKIIMDPKSVAIRYLKTWFAVDVISSINTDIFILLFNLKEQGFWLKIPSFLKVFHVTTLIKYLERFREWKETSLYRFKLMKMALLFTLSVIWSSCTLYVIAVYAEEDWIPEKGSSGPTLQEIWKGLRSCIIRVVMNFLLLSHGFSKSKSLQVLIMEVILISIGWIFKLGATAQIIQIVMKYSSLNDKYYQMVQQFQEYMKSKNLPETVQKRVLAYFEFRFQRNYYKENEILASLSNQLKQEIIVHTCGKLLNNTVIFRDIPQPFLIRVSYLMKMEIYLPNDVVVIAGSEAHAMYFILTGMVAVYDKFGKEVCHLADGSYFGEMSLFLSEEKRNASVVSIDTKE
ncbi:i[[h]] channel isoform e [Holotrichia oblita]|uniref:I[[h]] channel isoform e n=1 Tax=Holotrichia oblita TaxID=644536 RepID=A0ACB9T655_HOLOL|nr:i[[h]] channel isoform e [Holotrichia oblita]